MKPYKKNSCTDCAELSVLLHSDTFIVVSFDTFSIAFEYAVLSHYVATCLCYRYDSAYRATVTNRVSATLHSTRRWCLRS